jgi:polyisoprenyl-phosphate glycosyltransferase
MTRTPDGVPPTEGAAAMSDERPLLSVVCPAYEEQEVLPIFHAALAAALEPLTDRYRFEILYVDDGSRDGTLAVTKELAARDARVRYLSLSRNFGHQAALTAGLEHARGDAVVSLDSDLQHPPGLIPTLVQKWQEGHDIILTIRADDPRLGWFKRVSSTVFYRLLRRWSNLEVRAAASDFRLLSRRALDELLRLRESHRYLRGMVQWLGFAVAEVPFQPDERRAGVSKYTLRRMVRLAVDGLLSFSRVPLRLAVGAGLGVTSLSLVTSLGLALVRRADPVVTAVTAAVHLVGLCVLASLGVVGAYVARIYEECKGRPIYVLKDASPGVENQADGTRWMDQRPPAAAHRESRAA